MSDGRDEPTTSALTDILKQADDAGERNDEATATRLIEEIYAVLDELPDQDDDVQSQIGWPD